MVSLYNTGLPITCHVAQPGFEPVAVLLPLFLECWGYGYIPPHLTVYLVYVFVPPGSNWIASKLVGLNLWVMTDLGAE